MAPLRQKISASPTLGLPSLETMPMRQRLAPDVIGAAQTLAGTPVLSMASTPTEFWRGIGRDASQDAQRMAEALSRRRRRRGAPEIEDAPVRDRERDDALPPTLDEVPAAPASPATEPLLPSVPAFTEARSSVRNRVRRPTIASQA